MQSFAVGQVIESRHPDFKPDDLMRGDFSWQDYVATDGKGFGGMQKLPPFSCLIMNHFPEAMGKKRTKMVTGIVNEMRAINHSTCY
jgi:NADPH-dependent curcumin reductase CurA